ncbi:MAG TPA: nuclear transport factor 2 family protein [Chitinophagaceae bacterium]|nr:nuclear transport factor 2 family protein [Chitinophagaceae bacterium]
MKLIITSLCLLFTVAGLAQSDKDAVIAAANDYIDLFYNGDTTKLHKSISPNIIKYGYHRHKDSTNYAQGRPMSFQQMKNLALQLKSNTTVDKSIRKVEVLDVLDKTAAAKVTAWWGTDYLQLAKIDGKWMILHILWQSPSR